uniref:GST N-terminal domain-containing protein n=1 Tax=Cyanistes caeruleus TaxID=156563 RepID=A0A8C0V0Y7_CYACU
HRVSPQTLYTYPENWRAFKALIAAQYSGARLRVLSGPPHFHFGHTNRSPQFLQKFPLGKVPAFEGDDGFCVFESNAIAYYVSTEELRGSTNINPPLAECPLTRSFSFYHVSYLINDAPG